MITHRPPLRTETMLLYFYITMFLLQLNKMLVMLLDLGVYERITERR